MNRKEVIQKLEEAETEKDLREYLIHDLLYQKMIDSLEDWPMPWGGAFIRPKWSICQEG